MDGSAILVTGGSGYIGQALLPVLGDSAVEVLNLDLRRGHHGRFVPGDIRHLPAHLPPADTIIHLAGVDDTSAASQADLFAINVEGTRAVLDHAATTHANRVVLVSSIAVLGPSETPLDEVSPPRPTSAYGRSKLAAERVASQLAGTAGIQLVILRPGYVFGPGHLGNFGRMLGAIRGRRFVLPGRADTIKAGIYLRDVARLLAYLATCNDPPALVHGVYPDTPTTLAWADLLARQWGSSPVRVAPQPLVSAGQAVLGCAAPLHPSLGRLNDRVDKLRHSTNVVSRVLPDLPFAFAFTWAQAAADLAKSSTSAATAVADAP
ncbi:MAG: NAD-dependent epimerase/dehydratase family protein [Euzebya sp.]